MPTTLDEQWRRYAELEEEIQLIVHELSLHPDPDARYYEIRAEQRALKEAIGQPRFDELCREWL
jgi:hypothetical protein